jgi:hypothetical protein
MVGGAAYTHGKNVQRRQEHEYEQDQQLADMQQQPPYAAPAPAAAAPPPAPTAPATASSADRVAALTQLKSLLDSGVLTQAEFDVEKQKILQGS